MSRGIGGLLAVLAIVTLPGCEGGKDMQIDELNRQVGELLSERDDLESRLAAALNAGERAQRMALSLQQQLDEARSILAEQEDRLAEGPPGWEDFGNIAWTDVADDILFDSGRASFKKGGVERVAELAATIQSNWPDRQVWVIGHTDTDPIKVTKHLWTDNLDLSLNRAAAVAREFYKLGLDPQRLFVAGQGEHRPKAPNDSKDSKALNRRVEIVTVEKQGE
ncbi:MAG: OmpA family protein [Phycisphaerae bacterium]